MKKWLSLLMALIFSLSGVQSIFAFPGPAAPTRPTPDITPVIEKYRAEIPQIMAREGITGLAVAVVDGERILWAEGFGTIGGGSDAPVTTDTLFSIQSMSKSFTATAALFAEQEGLVKLDEPVSTYLPDFHVNSIFEEDPVEKMTLRVLLSHSAGFSHEAPVGGNNTWGPSFDAHIRSIQDTWLLFPVGRHIQYSNLGIDLAGYILETQSGMPFTDYVRKAVYEPLGMTRSAFSTPEIRQVENRAIGDIGGSVLPPADFLLLASGGVYTSANDLARYVMFHINKGAIDSKRLLREDLIETMYTPPSNIANRDGYGLGIGVNRRNGARLLAHGGGGFGFLSDMAWYPEMKLGALILTNTTSHHQQNVLIHRILDDIIALDPVGYSNKVATVEVVPPAYAPIKVEAPIYDTELEKLIQQKALPMDDATKVRAERFAGVYVITGYGFPEGILEITVSNGNLFLLLETSRLYELRPGVYFTKAGEIVDFTSRPAHYRQIPIYPVRNESLWRGIFATFALLLFGVLLVPVLAWIFRKLRARLTRGPLPRRKTIPVLRQAWALIRAAVVPGLLLCAFLLTENEMMFIPWPKPIPGVQARVYALIALPWLGLALTAAAGATAGWAWWGRCGSTRERVTISTLTGLLAVFFVIVLL